MQFFAVSFSATRTILISKAFSLEPVDCCLILSPSLHSRLRLSLVEYQLAAATIVLQVCIGRSS
jgi:hypothetical protein